MARITPSAPPENNPGASRGGDRRNIGLVAGGVAIAQAAIPGIERRHYRLLRQDRIDSHHRHREDGLQP